MKPVRGTALHGLTLGTSEPRLVQYTHAGSVDLLRNSSSREDGEPERTITLGELSESPQTADEATQDRLWQWRPKVGEETRQWVKAVAAAERREAHMWYTHSDEVVLVWDSVPSREHEAELFAADFQPAGVTWRAPLSEPAKRLAMRLSREPVRWHRPALGRVQAPPDIPADGEDELVARADQAWVRWWSLFRREVFGYPLHGWPTLDLDRGVLRLLFLRGEALWSASLDLRSHPLIYPASFQRGNFTVDLPGLAWEDFYLIPQIAADLAHPKTAAPKYASTHKRAPATAEPSTRELPPIRHAFLSDLVQTGRPLDLRSAADVERHFQRNRRDSSDLPVALAEARLITEAILLAARGLDVRLFLDPWGELVLVDAGKVAAARGLEEPAPALALEVTEDDRVDIRAYFRDAARQAAELAQEFGLRAPARALELLHGPPALQAKWASSDDGRWSTDVIEAFERVPGPRLVLDRLRGDGRSGRFILVVEGGTSEAEADRLAVVVLTHEAIEEIDWADSARNQASRAAIEARLLAALATARGECPDPSLFSDLADDLARRVQEIGTARDPADELADLLADLREPEDPDVFARWLSETGWNYAADTIHDWNREGTIEFLREFWDLLRDHYIKTTDVERRGDVLVVAADALTAEQRSVLKLVGDPAAVREVAVTVRTCEDKVCEVEAPELVPGDALYDLAEHTREQVLELHAHLDAMRETLTRAPRALDELRRALRLTAGLIESDRCQGASRAAAIEALQRAKRVHDAARALIVAGRPESSVHLAKEAAEILARVSAEAGILCVSGVQTLPFDVASEPAPEQPALASTQPPAPAPAPAPPSVAPAPAASPLAPVIDTLEEYVDELGLRVEVGKDEPDALRDVDRVLRLSAALIEHRAEADPASRPALWVEPPAPQPTDRLVVDLPSLRRALADEHEIVAKLDTPKATGELKVNVGRMWSHFTTSVYQSGDLPVLATREALQNSVDAIRAAVRTGQLRERGGRFAVTWDRERRTLTWEDNGVGMDTATIDSKFLSLGDTGKDDADGGAVGGFGVAKAVILGTSETFRWEIHTRNNRVVNQGFGSKWEIFEAEYFQGTRITIFDVPAKFDHRAHHARIDEVSLLDRLRELLAANDLPHITLVLNGEQVRPMFSRRGGSEVAMEGSWGDGTTARVKAYRRPPGDKHGAYYVRIGGLFQFVRSSYRGGLKIDVVIDLTSSLRPGDPGYPLNAARDALQARAHSAFYDLIDVVEREDESTGHSSEYETFDPEADTPGERSGAAELAELAAEALADAEFQAVLRSAADGIVDFYAEQAKDPGVDLPTESLAPPGSRVHQGEGSTRTIDLPPGLSATALVPAVDPDIASPMGEVAAVVHELRTMFQVAEQLERAAGYTGGSFQRTEVQTVLERAERGDSLDERDVRTLEDAIDRATDTAIGPGGGGLLQAVAITRTADQALARLAPEQAKKRPVRRNPFGRMAGLTISRKQYDRRRANQFRKNFARWLPHLTLWDATLRLLATEARIRRKFKPGFVLDDKVYGMTTNSVVYIQPDKLAQVIKAHKDRPMGIAAFLHGVACHELCHLDGRMYEGHSESFMVAREDLGFATGHLIPAIAVLAQRLLSLKQKPSAEQRRIATLEKQLARARAGKGRPDADVVRLQRQLTEARAALAAAEAESARIRQECDELRTRPAVSGDLRERAQRGLREARTYYQAVRARVLDDAADPATAHLLDALRGVAAAVARLSLRLVGGDLPDLDLFLVEKAVLDRELYDPERSVA